VTTTPSDSAQTSGDAVAAGRTAAPLASGADPSSGSPPTGSAPPAPADAGPLASTRTRSRWLRGGRAFLLLFLIFAAIYLAASGARLRQHSPYNHYVYLAEGWLHGRLALAGPPPNENDWAKVDVLTLHDGRVLKGLYGTRTGGPADRFYPFSGEPFSVAPSDIKTQTSIRYVSFPPFPAVLMLPFVAVWGLSFNDVLFTALWAALNPALLFAVLRDLARRGHSRRSPTEDLWLTAMFGVGSVYFYCSVVGQVWFTAHVVATTLVIGYVWASVDAARPALAGLCLGLGLATRPPSLGLMVPLFLFEWVRVSGVGRRGGEGQGPRARVSWPELKPLLAFAGPAAAVLVVLLVHNDLRFGRFTEFGHRYLNIVWQERIHRFGLFNYHFLSRNLAAALVLLPRILPRFPFVKISQHGMSLLVTSPTLAYTVMPTPPHVLKRPLWWTIALTALPSLLYQNSGYVQVGYRFSLDYMIFFVVLLAVTGRPLTRTFKALLVLSVGVNLFLALTFDRAPVFTYEDSFFPHGQN